MAYFNISCPNCGESDFIPFDGSSGIECKNCGYFIKDADLDDLLKEEGDNDDE